MGKPADGRGSKPGPEVTDPTKPSHCLPTAFPLPQGTADPSRTLVLNTTHREPRRLMCPLSIGTCQVPLVSVARLGFHTPGDGQLISFLIRFLGPGPRPGPVPSKWLQLYLEKLRFPWPFTLPRCSQLKPSPSATSLAAANCGQTHTLPLSARSTSIHTAREILEATAQPSLPHHRWVWRLRESFAQPRISVCEIVWAPSLSAFAPSNHIQAKVGASF